MEEGSSVNAISRDLPGYRNAEKLPQFLAALAATIGCFAMGNTLGYSSPVLPQLRSSSSVIHVTEAQGDWIGSLVALGALAGALFGGFLMNKLGRRGLLIFLSLPYCLGWLLLTYAQSVAMLYAGRIVTGMCTGNVALVVSMYIGEIAHPSIRGMLGTFIQLMISLGILFDYVVGSLLTWQWLSFLCGCVPAIMAFFLLFVPESPSHLLSKGRPNEAKAALKWLRGERYDIEDELDALIGSIHTQRISVRDLTLPIVWKPLVASVGLMILQQASGINNIIFYAESIFQKAGSSLPASTCSVIVGGVQLVATTASSCLVDSWGRKKLLSVSAAVMMLSLTALGVYFYLKDATSTAVNLLPLLSTPLMVAAFCLGFGPLPWMMMGELFSPRVRDTAGTIATFTNWACAFIVTNTFNKLQQGIGTSGAFWLYGGFCGLAIIFVAVAVPETKGKSLQQITQSFMGEQLLEEDVST